jgi:diketogulonate reductase-like aldo/keto reductase
MSSIESAAPAVTGPILKLNNGVSMPALGFGTFSNEGSKGETHKAVIHALNAGYRHLDCAWFYQNEDEVGTGMREFLSQNPSVQRSDIFITTKVWNHFHEPEDVEWSIKDSLERLQTPYVDAFLIHWPIAAERNEDRTVKIGADGKVYYLLSSTSFSINFKLTNLAVHHQQSPHRKPRTHLASNGESLHRRPRKINRSL